MQHNFLYTGAPQYNTVPLIFIFFMLFSEVTKFTTISLSIQITNQTWIYP